MKSSCALVVLFLAVAGMAEDAPIILSGPNRTVAICHDRDNDKPGCVTQPRATYSPAPEYPEKARKKRLRGSVVVAVVVGSDGLAESVKVDHSSSPEFDDSAVDTVKRWKFTPAMQDGKPVAVQIMVEVSFNLQ